MVWIKIDGVGNMATQLTSTTTTHDRSRDDPTIKDAVTTSIEKLVNVKTVSTEQQKPALGREQIRALVIDAFDSASNQLHAPNEDGIIGSLLSSANGDAKDDTPAVSVRSAKPVEIDTMDAERKCPQERPAHAAEPHEAVQGSYLYLPGFGFIYQDDNSDLGSDELGS